jgi:glucose/arabinose dehydrogenase
LKLIALLLTVLLLASPATGQPRLPGIKLVEVARKLQKPVYLTHDGTERMFIVEQRGIVRLAEHGRMNRTPYLDIVKKVQDGGECGLLGIAFHPDFAENGYLYVNYTRKSPKLQTVISEFKADPKSNQVSASSERILLTVDQPFPNHNGGQIKFGPDGMLYIGMGDGGSANDPRNYGQDPGVLLGKMLRIDVNDRDPYAVPPDNPFVSTKGYRPEIWATGLRNPWRFSFDRATGVCYTGDIGQNKWEEIDVIIKGGNYGWRLREASHPFLPTGGTHNNLIDPIAEYGRELGLSVTGGYVYRGKQFKPWQGVYFYADYGSGRIWGLKYEKGKVTANDQFNVTFADSGKSALNRVQPSSFGEDLAGELYICDHSAGVIWRMVPE